MDTSKFVMHVENPYTSSTKITGRLMYFQRLNRKVENRNGMIGCIIQKLNQIVDMITNMGVMSDECNHGHQAVQVCRYVGFR